jgi:hypothetical protein
MFSSYTLLNYFKHQLQMEGYGIGIVRVFVGQILKTRSN